MLYSWLPNLLHPSNIVSPSHRLKMEAASSVETVGTIYQTDHVTTYPITPISLLHKELHLIAFKTAHLCFSN
jgi:hypothetical protein